MSVAAATKELNFNSRRQQAVSASMERLSLPPNNGSKFSNSQVIDLRLPSGMAKGHFLDMQNSYVKLTINATTENAGTDKIHLPRNGIYNLIQKVEVLSSSSTLSVCENYNRLCNVFLDSECGKEFKEGLGGVQYGMTTGIDPPNTFVGELDNLTGELDDGTVADGAVTDTGITLNSGDLFITAQPAKTSLGVELTPGANGTKSTTFCFPLILTSLYSNSKMLPCFHNDNIVIRLHLASFEDAFMSEGAAAVTDVEIDPVSFIAQIVKLDASAMQMIEESNGGVYTMILDDWRNARGNITETQRHANINLGMSHQSLSRLLFAFYNSGLGADADIHGSRAHRNLEEYSFQLNGKNYPAQRIKANFSTLNENLSEVVAEIRASTRQASDFGQPNDISILDFKQNNPNGKDTQGKAFYEIDLEGLRASDQDSIYSGLNTVGGVTSLDLNFNGDAPNGVSTTVEIWGQYQGALKLNSNPEGMNIFSYSV